ncbi:MAG: hypothetical protein AAF957_13490 [Planctomycetota bacterium]
MNAAAEVLRQAADRDLAQIDPEGVARAAAEHVVDLEADSSACPACGGSIPRGARRCPECLLRLG